EVLSGADVLRGTAVDALKKWRFRPFLVNGKASRVITLIEIAGPAVVDQRRIAESYRASEYECRRRLESSPATAPAACEEAVGYAGRLEPERALERSQVLALFGQSLLINGRGPEGLTRLEDALDVRMKEAGVNDEGTAALFELVGIAQFAVGN